MRGRFIRLPARHFEPAGCRYRGWSGAGQCAAAHAASPEMHCGGTKRTCAGYRCAPRNRPRIRPVPNSPPIWASILRMASVNTPYGTECFLANSKVLRKRVASDWTSRDSAGRSEAKRASRTLKHAKPAPRARKHQSTSARNSPNLMSNPPILSQTSLGDQQRSAAQPFRRSIRRCRWIRYELDVTLAAPFQCRFIPPESGVLDRVRSLGIDDVPAKHRLPIRGPHCTKCRERAVRRGQARPENHYGFRSAIKHVLDERVPVGRGPDKCRDSQSLWLDRGRARLKRRSVHLQIIVATGYAIAWANCALSRTMVRII